ncbi:hypothetical protein DID88_004092 [Monilinia fructigena]|uniref:Uncharacterized protein n=1 Tax=Monilinia fructigena TaxID=38457 RepID=A0A395ISG7_9HELO|nr:hypothetical protein DID88_004092 [Monilinia fructigena]
MSPKFSRKRSVSPSAVARRDKRLHASGMSYSLNSHGTSNASDNSYKSNIFPPNIPEATNGFNTSNPFNGSYKSKIFPPNIPKSLNTFNTFTTSTTPTSYTALGPTHGVSSRTKINSETQTQTNAEPLIKQFVAKYSPLQNLVVRDPLRKIEGTERNVIGFPIRKGKTDNASHLPNSAAQNSFSISIFEAPEDGPVTGQVQLNTTSERWTKSGSLDNQFRHIDSPLPTPPMAPALQLAPKPPPRNPLRAFGKAERMAIARWMRFNNAVSSQGKHAAAFQSLLQSLGCKDPSFNLDVSSMLKNKTHRTILRTKKAFKECGAISFGRNDRLENMPIFEDWTLIWLEDSWDGVYNTRKAYTDKYLEGSGPYEEAAEIFVVEDPIENENVTNTGVANIRDSEHYCNPYKMNDYSKW